MDFPDYSQFEKQIDVIFTDKKLLQQAFVHRSFINEKAGRGLKHNERLEFLGDAVLELAVTGREHILANTFEALIGALYLDGGFLVAQKVISENLFGYIDEIVEQKLYKDAKSYFQEIAQEKRKITPHYELIDSVGPDHDKEFIMGIFLGTEKIAEGKGYSKQKAESEAARAGLEKLGWL